MTATTRTGPAEDRIGDLHASGGQRSSLASSVVPTLTVHRLIAVIALVGLMPVAFTTWNTSVQLWYTGLIAALGFFLAMAIIVLVVASRTARQLATLDWAVLVLALVLLVGWSISTLYAQPAYGTDEAAFTQLASHLFLHGHDPYGANLITALTEYRVPIQYATFTLTGHIVDTFGYPSLPILLTTPFVSLTGGVQSAIIAEVVALAAGMVLTFHLLPPLWRSLAPLVFVGLPILFGYSISGVTAILMASLLVVVANRWAGTGQHGRLETNDIVRAVFLGLAMSAQQWAWFVAPFIVLGIWRARRSTLGPRVSTRLALQFSSIAVGVFVLLNAPFIVWGPSAWVHGVLGPITQNAIPYGQGLIDASIFLRIGGGNLFLYTLAGVAIYLALLVVFLLWYRRLGRAAFVLPSLAFFFATRSLAEYFMTVVAVWIVSIVTNEQDAFSSVPDARFRLWGRRCAAARNIRWAVAGAFTLGSLSLCAAALAVPAPLSMTIMGVTTNGQLEGVWRVNVAVTNTSTSTLRPHFATNTIGQSSTFWNVSRGPGVLTPHQSATYTIVAPNRGSMPGISTPFLLEAYTASPNTISSTPLYTPDPYSTALSPSYINGIRHVGQSVVLQAELRNPFGARVDKTGVRIALGQVIYAQNALIPSEARVNSAPAGRTPVYARTDSAGIATFTITDDELQGQPLYFQSWILQNGGFPYGYSEIVTINWTR